MNNGEPHSDKKVNMWEELNRPKPRTPPAPEPTLPSEPRLTPDSTGGHDTPSLIAIAGGVLAVAVLGIAGFVVLGGGGASDGPPATAPDQVALVEESASTSTTPGPIDDASDGDDVATSPPVDDDVEPTTDPADPSEVDSGDPVYSPATPAGADDDEGYALLSGGRLYLRGRMPNTLIEQGAVNALEQLMGPGNVVSEYVIDPDAPFQMGQAADVYIEDTVLFEFGSAEIAPDFYALLQLGATLMQLQDGVTMEVYGHTDSDGSDETNLALSQARVDAVKAFYVAQGIDPDRVTAVGKGESEPVADNATPEGRQQNRRVEFVINGFTFSL